MIDANQFMVTGTVKRIEEQHFEKSSVVRCIIESVREYGDNTYADIMSIDIVLKDQRAKALKQLTPGTRVLFQGRAGGREYQGKVYNSLIALDFMRLGVAESKVEDDVPF